MEKLINNTHFYSANGHGVIRAQVNYGKDVPTPCITDRLKDGRFFISPNHTYTEGMNTYWYSCESGGKYIPV